MSLPIRGEHEGRHDVRGGPPYGGWAAFATVYPIYRSYIVTGHAVPRSGATPDTVQAYHAYRDCTGRGRGAAYAWAYDGYVVECGNM